ncbi:PDR/VanB family oxidoreductase [Nocardia sp. CDC159]|uniref:PDR/VanB family oxidoreductase n=1 Tax=Nocardia pulmonis TaxID=2951408 RepID=A0A9X2E651_9NOCA|nr:MULTISPECIES: PDR/VanB family oxidoreductase [Nocardia]MCM6773550.1 PDR/VanB family oxidoreductase [Nocardia pulmonis]MCM6786437.1 PDR/VanB family oxidoreductase [Nocardia sp. CDC159]
MTVRRHAPARLPDDLYGKPRQDRAIRVFDAIAQTRLRWSALINRRDPAGRVDDRRLTLTVVERRVEARDTDVLSLLLTAPDGRELPVWRPGAHLDLELPSGRLRQYSLCGDPADRHGYRIAVRRIPDGGGGSLEVHRALRTGARVTVRGPRNAFPFVLPGYGSPAARLHFVAGGIGITPILPMLRMADRLGVDWSMVYTGRSRDTIPFLDEVEGFGDRVTVRTDDAHGLPTAADLLGGVGPDTAVYCCGPVPMTELIAAAVREMPGVELHSERFSAPPVRDGKPFTIELARTGEVIEVPADRSALEQVLRVRPDTAYSCRQGFCRTCRVRVLAGEVEHRDTVLTPGERADGDMLICVSRCGGERLVLDL